MLLMRHEKIRQKRYRSASMDAQEPPDRKCVDIKVGYHSTAVIPVPAQTMGNPAERALVCTDRNRQSPSLLKRKIFLAITLEMQYPLNSGSPVWPAGLRGDMGNLLALTFGSPK